MQIQQLGVSNFRLLRDVRLALADAATVVVGRNNSGKTSLSEIFRRLATERTPRFSLEDFSSECYDEFVVSFVDYWRDVEVADVRDRVPAIELRIHFSYVSDSPSEDLGSLAHLIVDLDPECTSAVAVIRFQLEDGGLNDLLNDLRMPSESYAAVEKAVLSHLRDRIPKHFRRVCWAEDPNDSSNKRTLDWSVMQSVLMTDFVNAQRGLDDDTTKEGDSLAKIFESLFLASQAGGPSIDRTEVARDLQSAVAAIEQHLDGQIKEKLGLLVPSMQLMGYPGLDGPNLFTETSLEVSRLLTDNTKVRYAGYAGVPLPESYNGLGARNLILILLRLIGYYRKFVASSDVPGFQLIFIEEPEVHLHPQMQEVFIRQLDILAKNIAAQDGASVSWPVQFVVSTHSSHVANEAPFTSIRYFLCKSDEATGIRSTTIKDLSSGLGGVPEDDARFIHQYLTLTKCDLFFADKAILVEGTTERLLLPRMIEKMPCGDSERGLASQYLSLLEVGGAFAHKFFPLLDFLELAALVVTDIDSVGLNKKACAVGVGTGTSNSCIREWFGNSAVTIRRLLDAEEGEKERGRQRLSYQIPEQGSQSCGRSFEDAFMLANRALFNLEDVDAESVENTAYEMAKDVKKAGFALRFATEDHDWVTPRYIAQGLDWLSNVGSSDSQVDPGDALQLTVDGIA